MDEPKLADAPRVPPYAQAAVYENYRKCMSLLISYGILTGQIRVV